MCSGEYGTNGITETRGHSSFVYSVAEKPGGHWGKPGAASVKRETETDSQRSVRNSTGELIEFRLDSNIGGRFAKGILRCSQQEQHGQFVVKDKTTRMFNSTASGHTLC